MSISYRVASKDDKESIKELMMELQMYHYDLDDTEFTPEISNIDRVLDYTLNHYKYFIAVANKEGKKRAVGFIMFHDTNNEMDSFTVMAHRVVVSELIVVSDMRGNGIGQSLMSLVKNYAREEGASEITVLVYNCNSHAHDFYFKQGFSPKMIDMSYKL